MTYGMQLHGQQYTQGVQHTGYQTQRQYNTQVNKNYNVSAAQGVNPMSAMWDRSAQWMKTQTTNLYVRGQQLAKDHPYITAGVSAGAGMLTAMHTCPYAGATVAASGIAAAAQGFMPKGHPNVAANGGNQGGYNGNGRTFA